MHLASGDIPVQRSVLPLGMGPAVDATVKKMVEIAHSNYGSKSAKIRALAINIIRAAGIPDKDYYGEILAVHEWIKKNIRYFRDPVGQETLSYPEETAFNSHGGDCDDMTVLEIAMLGAIGIKAYPVVVGTQKGAFSHVYLHAQVPPGRHRNAGMLIPLDPIMKEWPAGKEAGADRIKEKKTYPHLADPMGSAMNGLGNNYDSYLADPAPAKAEGPSHVWAPSYLDDENAGVEQLLADERNKLDTREGESIANGKMVSTASTGMDAMADASRAAGDELGPRGPMTSRGAKLATTAIKTRTDVAKSKVQVHPSNPRAPKSIGAIDIAASSAQIDLLNKALDTAQKKGDVNGLIVAAWLARHARGYIEKMIRLIEGKLAWAISAKDDAQIAKCRFNLNALRWLQPRATGLILRATQLESGLPSEEVVLAKMAVQGMNGLGEIDAIFGEDPATSVNLPGPTPVDASESQKMLHQEQTLTWLRQRQQRLEERIAAISAAMEKTKARIAMRGIRAPQVTAAQPPAPRAARWADRKQGVSGLGAFDLVSTIKSPFVWGPALALGGIILWRILRKRKTASPTPATA